MYPSSESLSMVELLYGEAITRTDMDGTLREEYVEHTDISHAMIQSRQKSRESSRAGREAAEKAAAEAKKKKEREYEFTDCRNEEFEELLRTRPVHRINYLEENRQLRMQAYEDMLRRKDEQAVKASETLTNVLGITQEDSPPDIFLYSTQSLNFKALAMSKLREKVSQDHDASYTFSKNFMSQTLAAVDEEELKKKQKAEAKVIFHFFLTCGHEWD